MKIVIATIKSWNIENAVRFKEKVKSQHEVTIITGKEELTYDNLEKIQPDYVFFPHWSYIIHENIYNDFRCVVFHMTDLPYGRGGSPLQNLIVRGHENTMISALRVEKEIDAGPVYFKVPLELSGTADEIFRRASDIIFNEMIPRFLEGETEPRPQEGDVVVFARRSCRDGELRPDMTQKEIYDYIRMLDAEGYPNAYVEFGDWILDFSDARTEQDGVSARVCFRRKNNE